MHYSSSNTAVVCTFCTATVMSHYLDIRAMGHDQVAYWDYLWHCTQSCSSTALGSTLLWGASRQVVLGLQRRLCSIIQNLYQCCIHTSKLLIMKHNHTFLSVQIVHPHAWLQLGSSCDC